MRKDNELESMCPKLSFKERVIGFAVCFAVGAVLDFLAWVSLIGFFEGKPRDFAIFFSAGQIVTILGSAFLIGFKRQFKSMFHRKRWITTTVFLVALALTLISALVLKNPALTMVFLIIELGAYAWYVLSYLPFGQRLAKRICGSLCSD